ncbi:hypothetical protein CI238_10089 [Colletotrichum incanum]|uniref:Uncharacterized protein n=1 Tax=Colletotrichum incanum TaxID=1573173 RepID=A0A161XZY1_COLIC|nr:hypothetical protein CI238_10089 [Colletotrichum incanum]
MDASTADNQNTMLSKPDFLIPSEIAEARFERDVKTEPVQGGETYGGAVVSKEFGALPKANHYTASTRRIRVSFLGGLVEGSRTLSFRPSSHRMNRTWDKIRLATFGRR